jgi:hypothetical protein
MGRITVFRFTDAVGRSQKMMRGQQYASARIDGTVRIAAEHLARKQEF